MNIKKLKPKEYHASHPIGSITQALFNQAISDNVNYRKYLLNPVGGAEESKPAGTEVARGGRTMVDPRG